MVLLAGVGEFAEAGRPSGAVAGAVECGGRFTGGRRHGPSPAVDRPRCAVRSAPDDWTGPRRQAQAETRGTLDAGHPVRMVRRHGSRRASSGSPAVPHLSARK
ncbi:hypothetical protein GCM10022206_26470 [Streptomyces chiangmaiensis]